VTTQLQLIIMILTQVQSKNFVKICVLMKITKMALKFTILYQFHLRFVIPLLEDAPPTPTHLRNGYSKYTLCSKRKT